MPVSTWLRISRTFIDPQQRTIGVRAFASPLLMRRAVEHPLVFALGALELPVALHVLLREIRERLRVQGVVLIRRWVLADGQFVQRFACALPRVGETEHVVASEREASSPAVHAILHCPSLLAASGQTEREAPDVAIAILRFVVR